jgi:hypothetical protein
MGAEKKLIDGDAGIGNGQSVQIEMALDDELPGAQAAYEAPVESDHRALDVLRGVGDIERADAGDEIRQLGERFGIGIDHLAWRLRRSRLRHTRRERIGKLPHAGHLTLEQVGLAEQRCLRWRWRY